MPVMFSDGPLRRGESERSTMPCQSELWMWRLKRCSQQGQGIIRAVRGDIYQYYPVNAEISSLKCLERL